MKPGKVRNTTGSLTLTLKRGDELIISIPGKESVIVYCAESQSGRCSLNIRAPREYRIKRVLKE